jgi:hypothetical protein
MGSDKSFAKSRRRKFFCVQRIAGIGERATTASNDFSAKIFADYAWTVAHVDIIQPSSSLEGEASRRNGWPG